MFAIWLVWALLSLPGISFARRYFRMDMAGGGVGALATAYFWSFALLSPISILCYLTRAPLWVFSCAQVALIAAGAVDLVLQRAWRTWRRSLRSFVSPALLITLAVLVSSALVGGLLSGDARFHCARVRMLLDHGFNNFDPYVLPHAFSRAYHTNIYHAVLGSISQLSGQPYVSVWSATLPWAKLMQAGGFYALAWAIFRRRDVAWTSAALACISESTVTFSLCPNQLSGHWLVPIALAQLSYVVGRGQHYRRILAFATALLVITQIHALYAIFSALVGGSLLGVCWVLRWRAGWLGLAARHSRGFLLVALLTCAVPAPFLAATLWVDRDASAHQLPGESAGVTSSVDPRGTELGDQARRVQEQKENDKAAQRGVVQIGRWHAVEPRALLTEHYWIFGVLLCALALPRRLKRRSLVAAMSALTALIFLHFPPLFTVVAKFSGGDWVVLRFGICVKVALYTLGPGVTLRAIAMLARRLAPSSWQLFGQRPRALLNLCLLLGGSLAVAPAPKAIRHYIADVASSLEQGPLRLAQTLHEQRLLAKTLPRSIVLLTEVNAARHFVMLHDVYVITADRISPRVPRHEERWADLQLLLDGATRRAQATELLRKYAVSYAVLESKTVEQLAWLSVRQASKQRIWGRRRLFNLSQRSRPPRPAH